MRVPYFIRRLRLGRTPNPKTTSAGDYGEFLAAEYLIKHGYSILERNYRIGKNEIDIIARINGEIAFVEVKSRTRSPIEASRFGLPGDAVDGDKRRFLIRAASAYVKSNPQAGKYRFDVIEVFLDRDKTPLRIHHMPSAFTADRKNQSR